MAARFESQNAVTQSIVDRLTEDPNKPPPVTRAQSERGLRASLKHDLEWLLNSRRTPDEADETLPEVLNSLYHYGLPDVSSYSINTPRDQNRLAWLLEETVTRFEPRLKNVKVSMEPLTSSGLRVVRFHIEGLLRMDPAPERISFDTVLELTSGTYKVKGEGGA
jgi:type VI secretion system protein ImpF